MSMQEKMTNWWAHRPLRQVEEGIMNAPRTAIVKGGWDGVSKQRRMWYLEDQIKAGENLARQYEDLQRKTAHRVIDMRNELRALRGEKQ